MPENMLYFLSVLKRKPDARAILSGSTAYPKIKGIICFWQTRCGTIVSANVSGLPSGSRPCEDKVFGFHIHSGSSCSGNENDPFADALTHYNPSRCPHPHHSGDLPPLFENHGYAFQVFLTDRFCVQEVIGKTVIIHSAPDDFTTQPAGNVGEKIACGLIKSSCW